LIRTLIFQEFQPINQHTAGSSLLGNGELFLLSFPRKRESRNL